ncbi:MAG: hypothetical protein K0Q90_1052 [Paenibacillaceae bacterium]|nr:hypothetical protein [Paenibacillaceae bacterium]
MSRLRNRVIKRQNKGCNALETFGDGLQTFFCAKIAGELTLLVLAGQTIRYSAEKRQF